MTEPDARTELHRVLDGLTFDESNMGLDGNLVSDAVVLLHLIDGETGRESLTIVNTMGMGAYTQLGLVTHAACLIGELGDDE